MMPDEPDREVADSVRGDRVQLARVYRSWVDARSATDFAHAVVVATVLPGDWQVGEDAANVARVLIGRGEARVPDASPIRVTVLLDLSEGFVEVGVDCGTVESARVQPRRSFRTPSITFTRRP